MQTKIYVMTHIDFTPPPDAMYVPLDVKTTVGEHIAEKNCYYSELTGLYWVWKNVSDLDYVGICHYRRYLLNDDGDLFKQAEIEEILQKNDMIVTKNLQLNYTYYDGFGENHKPYYLDETQKVIADLFPDYLEDYISLVHQKHTYFGNMMICSCALFDEYMSWLFAILEELERRITIEEEDSYHRRIFGFISEFLLYLYVKHHQLRVKECMVGIVGAKAETKEIKKQLADYLLKQDVEGARQFFLEAKARRPDILMEASDIGGELHRCMEVIAICDLQQEHGQPVLLETISDFGELMRFCKILNEYMVQFLQGEKQEEFQNWQEDNHVPPEAVYVAKCMYDNKDH